MTISQPGLKIGIVDLTTQVKVYTALLNGAPSMKLENATTNS